MHQDRLDRQTYKNISSIVTPQCVLIKVYVFWRLVSFGMKIQQSSRPILTSHEKAVDCGSPRVTDPACRGACVSRQAIVKTAD